MKKQTQLVIRVIIGIFLMTVMNYGLNAQTYKKKTPVYFGGGFENFSTGNWHGAFYSPYINITKGRKSFNAGAVFQKRSMEFSGGKFSYSYNLSGGMRKPADMEDEEETGILVEDYVKEHGKQIIQLNFFSFAQYVHETSLSYAAQKIEQKTECSKISEDRRDWSKVRMSTAEAGVGFELYIKITKRVSWKNYIAGSVYYHLNYINGMYHERVAPSLMLGTGIHICPL